VKEGWIVIGERERDKETNRVREGERDRE